jgi:hypothetical protein
MHRSRAAQLRRVWYMSWLSRRGKRYYYRSIRLGRTVRRVYAGTGEEGERAAAEDVRRREARRARDEARREEEARWAEAEAELDEFSRLTETLARAALLGAGYFRHDRGQWRRRRNMPDTMHTKQEMSAPPAPDKDGIEEQAAEEEIRKLVRRAEQGDATVMPALRTILDLAPSRWKRYGGLGARVEALWSKLLAGENLMLREAVRRQVEEMKTDLVGDSPSPLERLLADRVAATWLQAQVADAGAAVVQGGTAAEEATALRRQNAANKRYLQTVKTLAVVQRLLRPRVSPAQVASRLATGGRGGVCRTAPTSEGVGVLN